MSNYAAHALWLAIAGMVEILVFELAALQVMDQRGGAARHRTTGARCQTGKGHRRRLQSKSTPIDHGFNAVILFVH